MRPITRALAVAMAAASSLEAAPVLAQGYPSTPSYQMPDEEAGMPPEVREAFRQGYDRGYRKGVEDGKRMVAAPPPMPAPAPPPTGPIRVTGAFYGSDTRKCDATRLVARQSNGRRNASFEVTNGLCGDPAPGDRKQLEVSFFCGGIAQVASAYEHRTIYMNCP